MIEIPHQLTIELEMKQRSQSRWGKRERAREADRWEILSRNDKEEEEEEEDPC